MPLFVCENCNTVENTALSNYWTRQWDDWPEAYRNKVLCSACGPPRYVNGEATMYGKWHGQFPKATPDEALEMVRTRRDEFVNVGPFRGGVDGRA